jgi:hypothetical protein
MPILGGTGNASEYAYRSYLIYVPDPFDWPDVTNAIPGVEYRSGYAKITGIKTLLPLKVSSDSLYSLTGNVFDNRQTVRFDNNDINQASFDEYTDPNTRFKPGLGDNVVSEYIGNNTSINLSKTASNTTLIGFNNSYQVIVAVGRSVQDWNVTTRPIDTIPNSFSFTSIASTSTSTNCQSNNITLSGLESGFLFESQITSGIGTIYVNNISRGTSANVSNNDIIRLDTTSSSNFDTTTSLSYRVGTYTTTWSVKTEIENLNVTIPSFTSQTNVEINTLYTSNQVTLSGFSKNSSLLASVSNINSAYEVERNGLIIKSFDASPIQVTNGDKIRLRLSSSNNYITSVSTTLTIGNSNATWSLTTINLPPPTTVPFTVSSSSPFTNQIIFTKQTGDGLNTLTFGSNSTGVVNYNIYLNAIYQITFSSGDVRINSNTQIALNDAGGDLDYDDLIISCGIGTFYTSESSINFRL